MYFKKQVLQVYLSEGEDTDRVIDSVIFPNFSVCLMVSKILFSQLHWWVNGMWKMLFNPIFYFQMVWLP